MLQKLIIKNYAIIDNLVFEPDKGLNAITGETGAGKSIILGAMSLILGERADSSVLINKDEKSVIEGFFDISNNNNFKKLLIESDLDADNQCIIRREIAVTGKSRAFINDTPVTLNVLNNLVSYLVDLHRQFGHSALEEDDFQAEILDAVGDCINLRTNYNAIYAEYKKTNFNLNQLKELKAQLQKEADFKQFLLDELINAGFKENEIEVAEQQIKQINNSERIKNILRTSIGTLDNGDFPIVNQLKTIVKQLNGILDVMPNVNSLIDRISSSFTELKDISDELSSMEEALIFDPEMADLLQQRIDTGYKLFKKHAVNSTEALLKIKENLISELKDSINLSEKIEQLSKEESVLYKELINAGEILSGHRKKSVPVFTDKMNKLFVLVGMPNAKLKVNIDRIQPSNTGIDDIQFLFDANKSGQFQLLQKTASGGEMSRIMLCIKSLTANALHLPTLVFDEVDTGISGEAARQVAILLRTLSEQHQIICITHQPQVAAKGTRHYYVYKEPEASGRLTTKIKVLHNSDRVLAIAKMIGGENPSEAALSNAKELIG